MIAYIVVWELGKNSTMSSVFILTYGARISWILGSKRLVTFLLTHNKKCIYIIYIFYYIGVCACEINFTIKWCTLFSDLLCGPFLLKKKFFFKDQQISFETHTYIYSFFLLSNTSHKACLVFSYIELFKHF